MCDTPIGQFERGNCGAPQQKWVCKQGNHGGYDEAAIKLQIDACKTLKAKA